MTSTFQQGRIHFVGRRKELDRLLQHRSRLEGNYERGRHLILIEGFGGIGRTAIAEQFLSMLDRDDRSFTPHGAYSAHLRRPALAPLFDALDDLLAEPFAQQRLRALFTDTTYYPLLARLPMLSASLSLEAQLGAVAIPDPDTYAALIASVLIHAARFRPVVLLLEDIQWMPEEDLAALSALNAGLRNAPVLILATLRRDAPEAERIREALRVMLLDQIYIQPLATEEIAELLTELYGARVSAQLTGDIAHASEGVPGRTVELTQLLEQRGVLTPDAKGKWKLGAGYDRRLLKQERMPEEKIRGLDAEERQVLLLLGCVSGQARRDELAEWLGLMNGNDAHHDIAPILERLEASRLIKPIFSNPDEVTFAHDSLFEAHRQTRTDEELRAVARMVLSRPNLRLSAYRWTFDPDLFRVLLEMLPDSTAERAEVIDPMIGSASIYHQWDGEHRALVCDVFLANRDRLTTREYARALIQAISWDQLFTRFADAIPRAETLYELTRTEPECLDLHAEGCVLLAAARFYNDRNVDVSGLVHEAWHALSRIEDPQVRMVTELQITRIRAALVPVGKPQEAINQMRRVMQLAEQLGIDDEKYNVLPDLVVRSARMRDEESLRFFCSELLVAINSGASAKAIPPFTVVSSVVRAAIISGDIFMARRLFESWSRASAPLAITHFVAYSYLTALFAYADGEPSVAADTAINAREEVLRHRSTSKQFPWDLAFSYAVLLVQLVPALVAAGRLVEGLGLTETMLVELELTENALPDNALPDVRSVLQLYRAWLRWRCLLPVEAPIALSWPSGSRGGEGWPDPHVVAFDPESARQAGNAYRTLYAEAVGMASPPLRFIADMLLATIECAERSYPEALAAIASAADACERVYDWSKEVEYRSAAITVRLRWGQRDPEQAESLLDDALENARALFAKMSEKGMINRIAQLSALFRVEAQAVSVPSNRDYAAQFERLGSMSQTAALAVVRNSRSADSGPIDRARLFLMGHLRLMRPHSYMELGEGVFGREAARTLLTALVAAEVLNRAPTREELALRVAPKARTQEQQKKALYNAASAARAACGSANSILAVGASSVELNINAELEGSVWVDALEIVRAAERGEELERSGKTGAAFDEFRRALLLSRKGEFAADVYAEWVDAARDRLREVVRNAALAVARIALRSGQYTAGIEAVSDQLTRDPFDEAAHRSLIRLYNESSNRSAALKQWEKCRKLIKREFGVELEPETMRLRREILAAGDGQPAMASRR
ncbi:MAG TPA: BTAD domain-containing putative transcriptional regulator [Candidatus Kapabacteria bacterium]|nr:BTAD domain-containing putative transcriptional regulator [Candidatus Kapabacteria bacterium]